MANIPSSTEELELNLLRYELRSGAGAIKLENVPMQLLILLARNPGRLVTREEIVERLWGKDVFVDTRQGINTAILKIRLALKDSAEQPRFIETVVGRGYRFIGPVRLIENGARSELRAFDSPRPLEPRDAAIPATSEHFTSQQRFGWRLRSGGAAFLLLVVATLGYLSTQWFKGSSRHPATSAPIHSVGVLPIENLSGDASQEYFADGITDELITNLATIRSLRVISRTSVMQYKNVRKPLPEIARALNVAAIVEGSLARSGRRMRLTVQLVDGRTDVHIWAQSFDRNVEDVLSLQAEVAEAVARAVGLQLTAGDHGKLLHGHMTVPAAYDAYLKGRYRWTTRTRRGLDDSIVYFKRAIAADPNYALAYAALADSYVVLVDNGWLTRSEGYPLIKRAATQALQIDSDVAEGHQMLGVVREEEWDWAGAEREYLRAIDLNPGLARAHHWYAVLLAALNRSDEAIAQIKQAVELDPMGISLYCVESRIYYLAHRFDDALIPLQSLKELKAALLLQHLFTGLAYLGQRKYSDAVVELRAVRGMEADDAEDLAYLACAYALAGRRSDALQILATVNRLANTTYVDPVLVAMVWSSLRDKDQAFHYLAEGYGGHSSFLINLAVDPIYDPLRRDPRFTDLVRRVGLPVAGA